MRKRHSYIAWILLLTAVLSFGSCGKSTTIDSEEMLSIISSCVSEIDTTQYKIVGIYWYDYQGSNTPYMVSLELVGQDDKGYEHKTFFSYGSPKPKIEKGSLSSWKFDKVRSICFDSICSPILPNIEEMKRQIPEGNEFQSVSMYGILREKNNTLRHTLTFDLDGKGAHLKRYSRRDYRTEYREMRGIWYEGEKLEGECDEINNIGKRNM